MNRFSARAAFLVMAAVLALALPAASSVHPDRFSPMFMPLIRH
jgi:hypothetical protein